MVATQKWPIWQWDITSIAEKHWQRPIILNWGDFERFNRDWFYFTNANFRHNGLFSTLLKASSFSGGSAFYFSLFISLFIILKIHPQMIFLIILDGPNFFLLKERGIWSPAGCFRFFVTSSWLCDSWQCTNVDKMKQQHRPVWSVRRFVSAGTYLGQSNCVNYNRPVVRL